MARGAAAAAAVVGAFVVIAACASETTFAGDPTTTGDAGADDTSDTVDSGGANGDGAATGDAADASACMPANATGAFDGGACVIAKCDSHRLDCDDNPANGCELADNTSPSKCGGCNQICEDCVIAALDTMVKTPVVNVPVKPDCASSLALCCAGGDAGTCLPVPFDYTLLTNDAPRIVTSKPVGQSRADVTLRVRIKTQPNGGIPVKVPNVGDCLLEIDTTQGTVADARFDMTWATPTTGAVETVLTSVLVSQFDDQDLKLVGSTACVLATLNIGAIKGTLIDGLTDSFFRPAFASNVCAACPCPGQ